MDGVFFLQLPSFSVRLLRLLASVCGRPQPSKYGCLMCALCGKNPSRHTGQIFTTEAAKGAAKIHKGASAFLHALASGHFLCAFCADLACGKKPIQVYRPNFTTEAAKGAAKIHKGASEFLHALASGHFLCALCADLACGKKPIKANPLVRQMSQ